jgi:hypothetical protein
MVMSAPTDMSVYLKEYIVRDKAPEACFRSLILKFKEIIVHTLMVVGYGYGVTGPNQQSWSNKVPQFLPQI